MNSDDLKQFMKPKTGIILIFSILIASASIAAFVSGQILIGFAALAGAAVIFYSLVFVEWKSYRKNLKNYEAKGVFHKLSTEFRKAEVLSGIPMVRFGRQHLFIRHESKVLKYNEIIAIEKRQISKDRKKQLLIQSRNSAGCLPFRSLFWPMDGLNMERVAEELAFRNPAIKVIQKSI